MTTQKPIDTNCGSAPKSTGTASPEGKTASRVNALELEALAAGCHDSFEPARAHQLFLIDSHRCRLAIPPSRRSRDAAGTRSPVPKHSFRGLGDGLLDEVFDSLDTFTRLEHRHRFDRAFSPLPPSPGCCASTWQRGQPHARPNSLKSRAVSSKSLSFFLTPPGGRAKLPRTPARRQASAHC